MMDNSARENLIQGYVQAYNEFDVDQMISYLDDEVRFVNIANGEINLSLIGRRAFWDQARQAADFFSQRTQTVISYDHRVEETEIDVQYHAVLAVDLPNGLQRGQVLNMKGKSIFRFKDEKISALTDMSE
jgi:hypothetical protein